MADPRVSFAEFAVDSGAVHSIPTIAAACSTLLKSCVSPGSQVCLSLPFSLSVFLCNLRHCCCNVVVSSPCVCGGVEQASTAVKDGAGIPEDAKVAFAAVASARGAAIAAATVRAITAISSASLVDFDWSLRVRVCLCLCLGHSVSGLWSLVSVSVHGALLCFPSVTNTAHCAHPSARDGQRHVGNSEAARRRVDAAFAGR